MFFDSAKESYGHAQRIGEKIVALGGVPTLERNKVQVGDDIHGMLQHALEFEQNAVKHYLEALELAEGNRPLVVLLEDILLEEQDGVDQLQKIVHERSAGAAGETRKKSKTG
jgi:bacterioferritin